MAPRASPDGAVRIPLFDDDALRLRKGAIGADVDDRFHELVPRPAGRAPPEDHVVAARRRAAAGAGVAVTPVIGAPGDEHCFTERVDLPENSDEVLGGPRGDDGIAPRADERLPDAVEASAPGRRRRGLRGAQRFHAGRLLGRAAAGDPVLGARAEEGDVVEGRLGREVVDDVLASGAEVLDEIAGNVDLCCRTGGGRRGEASDGRSRGKSTEKGGERAGVLHGRSFCSDCAARLVPGFARGCDVRQLCHGTPTLQRGVRWAPRHSVTARR